ncbi:hypothetical protein [Nocardioides gilvus]|uniref:hypothetical protein n=1 Tax=Nocardioides gilvus TaxID=1735589 RepID=UPI0013A55092|nr:hypothetical protein [Nocardioides gilvus]
MTRGRTRRDALTAILGALLCAGLLSGCTEGLSGLLESEDEPPATLEAEWSIEGHLANPDRTGTHHWATHQVFSSGVSRYRTTSPGALLLVDARTGRTHPKRVPGGWPCQLPNLISDGGATPVLLTPRQSDATGKIGCSVITVWDATSGKKMWSNDDLDLTGLAPDPAPGTGGGPQDVTGTSAAPTLGADDRAIVLVGHQGRSVCFATSDGKPLAEDDPACTALHDRLTGADLPELTDPDGKPARSPSDPEADSQEIGRTDEVLLVRLLNERSSEGPFVRAHDLETGETLWQDDDLTPDRHEGDAWSRDETYFVAPSGIVRVSYEHPADEESAHLTPMVLTAVDPRTGKDLRPIARVEGAWFNHQFGDMTVALTEQDLLFKSTISGFELPTW